LKFKDFKTCFIAAEISSNHGQNFKRAVKLIKKAKECGADAVKFQACTPDTLTLDVKNKYFEIEHPHWGGQTLYQLYQKAYTPWNWFKELKKISDDLGILFFATAFDKTSVDFLENLNVPLHKISSFELVDLPLIEHISKTKKPLILSTGMATLKEIEEAVDTAKKAGAKDIMLLKCVSTYPADPKEMNLKTINDMERRFKVPIGLSDHTLGTEIPIAAVTLGAKFVEKHFTLLRKIKTPDAFFSLEPEELRQLTKNIRNIEQALGTIHYGLTKEEQSSQVFRRSLFVIQDIKKGEFFSDKNIRSIRPAYGLKSKHLKIFLGKRSKKDIKKGSPLNFSYMY
jgi:pseudaminic acid synthase